jgi:hypothetical protein
MEKLSRRNLEVSVFARVLILSLSLTCLLPATMIEEVPPVTVPAVEVEETPVIQLNLNYLLGLAFTYNYIDIEDPEIQANVRTVITPMYEALLNYLTEGMVNGLGPGFETPATETSTASLLLATPLAPGTTGLDVSVPEPGTWGLMLCAAGALWWRQKR